MLENSKDELKTLILLEFTKRLIIAKNPTPLLRELTKPKTKKEKLIQKIESKIPIEKREIPMQRIAPPMPAPRIIIPRTRLPPQFAYLRPDFSKEIKINFGKVNPLVKDPAVRIIECNGTEQPLIVKGTMGSMPTEIVLNEDEINDLIQEFSKKAKIPVDEGVTKIILGKYVLSAIISKDAGSRFILEKIQQRPPQRQIKR